jgi:hypothetical protein
MRVLLVSSNRRHFAVTPWSKVPCSLKNKFILERDEKHNMDHVIPSLNYKWAELLEAANSTHTLSLTTGLLFLPFIQIDPRKPFQTASFERECGSVSNDNRCSNPEYVYPEFNNGAPDVDKSLVVLK